jgi:hypothetical protein
VKEVKKGKGRKECKQCEMTGCTMEERSEGRGKKESGEGQQSQGRW